jgi:hypothetical protein
LLRSYKINIDLDDYDVLYARYEGPHKTPEEKIQSVLNMLAKPEPGKTYIFIEHPGINNEELRSVHHIGYENVAANRQDVTDVFTSEKIKGFIKQKEYN